MLCLTPITLGQPKKTLNVKSTVINESFTVNMKQKKQNLTSETSTSSGSFVKKMIHCAITTSAPRKGSKSIQI